MSLQIISLIKIYEGLDLAIGRCVLLLEPHKTGRHKFFPSNKDEQYYCMQIAVKLIIFFKQKLYNLSMEKSSLKMEPSDGIRRRRRRSMK